MNLTIENSFDNTPERSQALALATYGDRQTFLHCKLVGFQDTYFSGSNYRAYFKDCLIIGAVDYIYGPSTILFDSCQIHNVRPDGGYITAASTPQGNKYGYIFNNCWISSAPKVAGVDLGRPWRPYAHVVFLNCYENSCVSSVGWNNWGNTDNEATAFYAEYKCYGPGSDTSKRVAWSHQLSDAQAAEYTLKNIYAAASNPSLSTSWLPEVDADTLYQAVKKHSVKFMDPMNLDARLNMLSADGEEVPGFHPDSLLIPIELPSGTTTIPVLAATSANEATSIDIAYPEEIPGFATVTVQTPYQASVNVYKVYFSVDSSFYNADLLGITMKDVEIPDFDPDRTHYDHKVPEGTSRYITIRTQPRVKDAKVKYIRPDALPGEYTFYVTAVDGYTMKNYYVYVSFDTGITETDNSGSIRIMNPVGDQIEGMIHAGGPGDYRCRIFDTDGKLVLESVLEDLHGGKNYFSIDASGLEAGLYFYMIDGPEEKYRGQLIK